MNALSGFYVTNIEYATAPGITATGNSDLKSFNLRIKPSRILEEIAEYRLLLRQNGELLLNKIYQSTMLEVSNNMLEIIDVNVCNYNYTFEIIHVKSNLSSGEQPADPNLSSKLIDSIYIIN